MSRGDGAGAGYGDGNGDGDGDGYGIGDGAEYGYGYGYGYGSKDELPELGVTFVWDDTLDAVVEFTLARVRNQSTKE